MTETPYITVPEVAEYLGMHRNTIYRACQAGGIPHKRVGGKILIPKYWVVTLDSSEEMEEPPAEAKLPESVEQP